MSWGAAAARASWPRPRGRPEVAFSQPQCRRILGLLFRRVRYHVEGLAHVPASGPALLVLNHTGWEEILVLILALTRRTCFVALHELLHLDQRESWERLFTTSHFRRLGPLARRLLMLLGRVFGGAWRAQLQAFGVIPVRVADEHWRPRFSTNGVLAIMRALSAGELVILFPEGGLNRAGTMKPFRPGLGAVLRLLARRGVQVPVLCAAQRCARAVTPLLGSRYPARVLIAPPVQVELDEDPACDERLARALQDRVAALLPALYPTGLPQDYAARRPLPEGASALALRGWPCAPQER